MNVVSEADVEKATSLLGEIREKSTGASDLIKKMCLDAERGVYATSKGISFLEVKYQLLLSYLIDLTYTMLRKVKGLSIVGEPSIERLVEIRTVLEKIRPIDHKLKYQIDKIVRTAETGRSGEADPLRLKANPDNLESKLKDKSDSGSGEEDDEGKQKNKLYQPPKLAAAHYAGDETMAFKQQRRLESAKKRAINTDIMRELREQYHDGPVEIRESRDLHRLKEDRQAQERQRYEEDNFVRLQVSKKERHKMKRLATMSSLDTLTHFGNISSLDMEDAASMPARKRQKSGGRGRGKGKFKGKGSKGKRRH